MDLELAGRAYVVTGISRGIGRCVAEALLAEGALVAGCARRAAALDELQAAVPTEQRDRLLVSAGDATDQLVMAELVDRALTAFGRLDGVVANAGAGITGGVLDTPASDWERQIPLRIRSILHLVRPALAGLEASDAARIVVINGVTAHAPEPHLAVASAAGAVVANLVVSLARELADRGILVNAVNLGPIATDRQRRRHQASGTTLPFDDWAVAEAKRRGILLGRLGRPREVVPPVLLLLSPRSSYITGTSIDVAGGSALRV